MSTASGLAPSTLHDLGVRRSVLEDLALKTIYYQGEASLQEISDQMKISPTVTEEIFLRLRRDHLCEVTGMIGPMYRVQTTSQGRTRALELLAINQYVGPAPVNFEDYVSQVEAQSVRNVRVTPDDVECTFGHMVLDESILTQVGTAITSGRVIFLYGPTGTGKTSIAEAMAAVLRRELVRVPHAVEIDGQIITVFDAHLHEPADADMVPPGSDRRWVLCHRPKVFVGGELTIEMLDLEYNPLTKFYTAPVQMKANNGALIIDDFGRQRMRPDQLLNRWVVPLDRRIDFLSLAGGKKLQVPFDMLVIFATNMDVSQMVDQAFLRRIQTKIRVEAVTREQFFKILENVCTELGVPNDATMADAIVALITNEYQQPLRPCYARDIINQICWAAKYHGTEPRMDEASIARACRSYFVSSSES